MLRVHTDAGMCGIGEAGVWGAYEAVEGMILKIAQHLVGQDPQRIEHHWHYIRRQSHYRGSVLMGALSAIDIALWDIKGRLTGLPVWQLVSGRVRDRVRVYTHVMAPTKEALIDGVGRAVEAGYTAVGHLTPFLDDPREHPSDHTPTRRLDEAVRTVARYREAAGATTDLCLELHRRLSPPEALALARALEPFRPMFLEDPVRPDNFDATADITARSPVPIATGERLTSPEEFAMLLDRRGCHYLRPSPGLCGGITGTLKIAALAEAHGLPIVPHNPFGPVMTAACAQIAAAVPGVALLEHTGREAGGPAERLVDRVLPIEAGYLAIPEAPGLGIDLVADPADAWPVEPRPFVTRLHEDGSVVDH
jgi:galactonate dehydratase